jgi:hypothetical protein
MALQLGAGHWAVLRLGAEARAAAEAVAALHLHKRLRP